MIPQEPQDPQKNPFSSAVQNPFAGAAHATEAEADKVLSGFGRELSREARGFGENLYWQSASAAKTAADSITHAATTAVKLVGGVGGLVDNGSFGEGWQSVGRDLQATTGTSDPGVFELWEGIGRSIGLGDDNVDIGASSDRLINERLGRSRVLGDTIGSLMVFAHTPGIGEMGAKVAKPMANVLERGLAKAAAKRGGVEVAEALKTGNAWEVLAQSPEWKKAAGLIGKGEAFLGRNVQDLVGATAANIAQSYAISTDDDRSRALVGALVMSPFMVPIARLGESIGSAVLAKGIDRESAAVVKKAFQDVEAGRISMPEMDRIMRSSTSPVTRGLANAIAGAAEGTAFFGLSLATDKDVWNLAKQWQSGDADAGAELFLTWMGTAAGVAGAKMASPGQYIPFWKALRPDLNTLDTYVDAEANKRAAEAAPEEPPQQPQQPAPPLDEATGRERFGATRPLDEQGLGDRFAQQQAETRAQFGWAKPHTAAALKAGWEPTFPSKTSGEVDLRHGKDFLVQMEQTADGSPQVTVSDRIMGELRKIGADTDYPLFGSTHYRATGSLAHKMLDDLALLATYRKLQGDLTYQRLGMREVDSGIYADENGKLYMMQLDGSTATKNATDIGWKGKEDVAVVGGFEPVAWESPTSAALADWVVQKQAVAPDQLVDGIIGQSLALARSSSESPGAQQLRQFLTETDWTAMQPMLRKGEDRMLALRLGSLAANTDNAVNVSTDLRATAQQEAAKKMAAPADRADYLRAMEGELPQEPQPETIRAQGEKKSIDVLANPADATGGRDYSEAMAESVPSLTERMAKVDALRANPPKEAIVGSVGAELSHLTKAGVETVKGSVKKGGLRRVKEEVFSLAHRVLQEAAPKSSLPWKVRRVNSEAARLKGETRAKFNQAKKAFGTKEGKEILNARLQAPGFSEKEGTIPQWLALADKQVAAETPVQRDVQEGMQNPSLALWNESAAAGFVRDQWTPEGVKTLPMSKITKAKTERVPGEASQHVYNDARLRKAWFEALVKANPDQTIKDPETGEVRKLTADDLNREWVNRAAGETTQFEHEAAMEMTRRFKNVAYEWKGPDGLVHEMYDTNPFTTMQRITERQAQRIAHVKEFGQDLPESQRAVMLKDPTLPANVRANLERGGTKKAVQDLVTEIRSGPDASRAGEMEVKATRLLNMTQGLEPFNASKLAEWFSGYTGLASSVMSSKASIYDVPEPVFRFPVYVGLKRALKAIGKVISSPVETPQYFERIGAIDKHIAELAVSELKGKLAKITNTVGFVAHMSERIKGAMAGVAADLVIADAKAGKATLNDLQVAQDILGLSGEDMAAIKSGKISPALESQWRRELVQLMTSRGNRAEGTSFAASPNIRKLMFFTGFATRRAESIARTIGSVVAAKNRSGGWWTKDTGVALGRMASLFGGMVPNGLIGAALGAGLAGLFAGSPIDEGFGKFWKEMTAEPGRNVRNALLQGTLGGPLGQTYKALVDSPTEGRAWASLTVPTNAAFQIAKMFTANRRMDWWEMYQLASNLGFVPFREEVGNAAQAIVAAHLGRDPQVRVDSNFVQDFKRDNNIVSAFGARNKAPEFYDAIANIEDALYKSGGDVDAAYKAAAADIKTALGLAKEESVAGAIEGHQWVRDLTNEQREKMAARTDEKRMNRVYQHDAMLREMAKRIRRQEGTNPTEWEAELDAVTAQAKLGGGDRWRGMVDRALDETAQRLANKEPFGHQIDDVAERLSMFPDQLGTIFDERQLRALQGKVDSLTRARRIAGMLRSRISDRVQSIMQERARGR